MIDLSFLLLLQQPGIGGEGGSNNPVLVRVPLCLRLYNEIPLPFLSDVPSGCHIPVHGAAGQSDGDVDRAGRRH